MANVDMYKSILCAVLDCGYLDLNMLDDADEDFVVEAIDEMCNERCDVSLNGIFGTMFSRVQYELRCAVENRIEELEGYEASDCIGEDEKDELESLKELDPDNDVTWYINWTDTHIYICEDKEEIYRKYFEETINDLEAKMGLCFE